MIINKLTIHNIASICDAEIDFNSPPLSNADVFLISGKTGAGKSTVLDCICVALYNATPRLDNKSHRTENLDDGIKESDIRNLMRRNTSEASVKLEFKGANGIEYVAHWYVRRARKKTTGNLQNVVRELYSPASGLQWKGDELQKEIIRAVGLDFEQFCRTTMLAQGEFTRFLKSNKDEKSQILEKILDCSSYSAIGLRIYQLFSQHKSKLDTLVAKVKDIDFLSQEDLHKIVSERDNISSRIANLTELANKINVKWLWLSELNHLDETASNALWHSRETFQVLNSPEIQETLLLLNDYSRISEAKVILERDRCAREQLKILLKQEQKLQEEFANLSGILALEELNFSEQQISHQKETEILNSFQTKEDTFKAKALIDAKSKEISNLRRNQSFVVQRISSLKQQLEKSKESHEKILAHADKTASQLLAAELELEKTEKEFANKQIATLRQNVLQQQDILTNLRIAASTLKNCTDNSENISELENKASQLKSQIDSHSAQIGSTQEKLALAKELQQAVKRAYEIASESLDWTRKIRSQIQEGDICPICHRPIEQCFNPDAELADKRLAELSLKLKQCNDDIERIQANLNSATVARDTAISVALHTQESISKQKRLLADNKAKLKDLLSLCSCKEDEIEGSAQRCCALLEQLLPKLAESEKLEEKVKEINLKVKNLRTQNDSARESLTRSKEAVAEIENKILVEERTLNAITTSIKEAYELVVKNITGNWKNNFEENIELFTTELENEFNCYNLQINKVDNLSKQLKETETVITAARRHQASIQALKPFAKTAMKQADMQIKRIDESLHNLYFRILQNIDSKANTSAELRQARQELSVYIQSAGFPPIRRFLFLAALPNAKIEEWSEKVINAKNSAILADQALRKARLNIELHKLKKPEIQNDETLQSLDTEAKEIASQKSRLEQEIGAIDQRLKSDAANRLKLKDLIEEIDSQKKITLRWEKFNKIFGDSEGKNFRTIALRFIFGHLLEKANVYLLTLMPRYRLSTYGDSFAVMVRDSWQHDKVRPSTALSGGEGFVVSLALALALSDIGSRLQVDMLFIDEGFGTLSDEALNNAIDTLRRLHNKSGRRVGIISHVAELGEKIPVKILVEQEQNSSHSKIKIESNIY